MNTPFSIFAGPSRHFIAVLLLAFSSFVAGSALGEDFFVSPQGDDNNPGTSAEPFRTVGLGCLALAPGDRLLVRPGFYRDEGTIFLRFVEPENFEFFPLVGSPTQVTQVVGISKNGRRPVIFGSLDVRGSYIRIKGLEFQGNREEEELESGIGVFESHNITITDCRIIGFGGNGIGFSQCDIVNVSRNIIGFNAFTNPNQSSGISLYQSVVRTNSNRRYGAVISQNICVGNENRVPPSTGDQITDGNGIIIDDFLYEQQTGIVEEAMMGFTNPQSGTGVPEIEFEDDGTPLSYQRATLIRDNFTLFNGGRGIHIFGSDFVDIIRNRSYFNLRSTDLTDGLPRDANTNLPFFVNGEINSTNSNYIRAFNNFSFTDNVDSAGAAEQFFDRAPANSISPNTWRRNRFLNRTDSSLDVNVFGVDSSELSQEGR